MKILFMGTPDFAVKTLEAILDSGHTVTSVITQPDKPKGRGHKLAHPPVYEYAEAKGLKIHQPVSLKNNAISDLLLEESPDLIVVVAYGKILPEYVLNFPRHGCINVHASLLPKYRGAAPIQRAIIDGQKITGVTTMYMEKGLDTGDMLEKVQVEITDNDNFETLHDKLADAGSKLIISTLKAVENGAVIREKQDDSISNYAEMITKETARIDWGKPAYAIDNLVRGLYPVPKAFSFIGELQIKITKGKSCEVVSNAEPGTVIDVNNNSITVKCLDDSAYMITELQPAGKRIMPVSDYLKGNSIVIGQKFN